MCVCVCVLRMHSATPGPFQTGLGIGPPDLAGQVPGGLSANEGGKGEVAFPGAGGRQVEGVKEGYGAGCCALSADRGLSPEAGVLHV